MAVKEPVLRKVKISDLKLAEYNPQERTKPTAKGRRLLKESIDKIGLIYPIAVTPELQVIDGHRRVSVCKELGWKEIPVLVQHGADRDTVYAEVNANSQKLSGANNLNVWLKRPGAVTKSMQMHYRAAAELVGLDMLKYAAKNGCSLLALRRAKEAARYVDRLQAAFVRKAFKWVIDHRNHALVAAYMRLKQDPAVLYNAVLRNQDLRARFTNV